MTGIDVERHEGATPSPPPPPSDPTAAADDADGGTVDYRLGGDPSARAPKLTRRGKVSNKVSKWDRPPPPRDWRWYVGNLGRTLIAVGILMFGFVAYQLWGTGIENAAAQRALEDDFEELLEQFEPIATPTPVSADEATPAETATDGAEVDAEPAAPIDTEPAAPADAGPASDGGGVVVPIEQPAPVIDPVDVVPAAEQNLPPVEDGDAIAKIEIPDIGVSDIVVAGIDVGDLKRGPGHFPDTPLPGQLGNSAIAGHRTTYGAPFFRVDELDVGDEIRVTTLNGAFVYRVTGQQIVSPSEYQVVATTDPTRATLTLVSCHPRYTAQKRIIISAELDPTASGAVGEPVLNYGRPEVPDPPTELPAEDLVAADVEVSDDDTETAGAPAAAESSGSGSSTGSLTVESVTGEELLAAQADREIADVFSKGWFSDPAANPHVGGWGLLVAAIAILSYLVSRRLRRDWAGALIGIVPFVVALYFFFQNVNRLLPPNL